MSRRKRCGKHGRNQDRPGPPPRSTREQTLEALRRFVDEPPPTTASDPAHIRICPLIDSDPPLPLPGDDAAGETATPGGSRANAVKTSYRSKILFDANLFSDILNTSTRFIADLKPAGELEQYLVRELARSAAIDEKIAEQLILDDLRVIERVGTSFDMDNASRVEKLGATLKKSPEVVAGALGRTKQGALYMINQWSLIDEAIDGSGGLDEEQRQVVFDLLGIPHVFRSGNRRVPAGTDKQGLKALVARQISLHKGNIERTLDAADAAERKAAALGIVSVRDSATRLLRADQNRARRRFSWCFDTLMKLRAGVDPASIIDPETGKRIAPGPLPVAVKTKATPAASAPGAAAASTAAAAPAPAPQEPVLPPLPEGLPAEAREMYLVAAGAILGTAVTSAPAEPCRPPTG